MKVYPDANIYVAYLLGQRGEELADRFFKLGIGCKFSIVASNTVFAEVAQRCGESGKILLQKNIDDFTKAGKLELLLETPAIFDSADRINMESGEKYGINDVIHVLLATAHADVFITNDAGHARFASRYVKAVSLSEFLKSEP